MFNKTITIAGRYEVKMINLIIGSILILGLIATVIYVQRQQIFRSGANVNPNAFEVRNDQGQRLECDTNGICQTDTLRVRIKLKDRNSLAR